MADLLRFAIMLLVIYEKCYSVTSEVNSKESRFHNQEQLRGSNKEMQKLLTSEVHVRVEEGQTALISCAQHNIIRLARVSFGNGYRTQTCGDADAMRKIIHQCQHQQSCSIVADRSLFTDSTCDPSITEKFQAVWNCVDKDRYVEALEGNVASLSCDPDYVIQLNLVMFVNDYKNPTCGDQHAKDKLQHQCEKQRSCSILVDRNLFTESTCATAITEMFLATWFCRYNSCLVQSCENNAACVINDNYLADCNCTGGWTGTNCDVSPCNYMSCENNGTCQVDSESGLPVCSCPMDYTGPTCQVFPCLNMNCENNGTCQVVDESGFPVCLCPKGYSGPTCQVSPCHNMNCENNGTCQVVDESGLPVCVCPVGYSGPTCQVSPCHNMNCENNGTCQVVDESGLPVCLCPVGYSGPICQVSPCHNMNCENNGTCRVVDESGLPVCLCPVGYSGPTCQGSPCHNMNCENNGTCQVVDESGLPVCLCPVGYSGPTCQDLKVTVYKQMYSVAVGETVTLACKVSGSPSASGIYWTKTDDNGVIRVLRDTSEYSGSTVTTPSLTINRVDMTDQGMYVCTAISPVGTFNSSQIKLDVISNNKITVVEVASDGRFYEDSSIKFNCLVNLEGNISFVKATWKLNGAIINPTSVSRWKIKDPTDDALNPEIRKYQLIVSPLHISDSGKITCHVSDGNLQSEGHIYVDVLGKPVVSISPITMTVNQGESAVIKCTVIKSYSLPTSIIWYKNSVKYREKTGQEDQLFIHDIQEKCEYRCMASNLVGEGHSRSARITITKRGKLYQYCPNDVDNFGMKWNTTVNTAVVSIFCFDNYQGYVTRRCNSDGVWEEPDYSTCVRKDLQDINDESDFIKNGVEVVDIDTILKKQRDVTVKDKGYLTSGDLEMSSSTLDNIANHAGERTDSLTENQLEIFVASCDNLLEDRHKPEWKRLKDLNLNGIARVAKAVTSYTKAYTNINTTESNRLVHTENIVVQVGRIQADDMIFPDRSRTLPSWLLETATVIRLNKTNIGGSKASSFSSTYYRNISDLFRKPVLPDGEHNYESHVNSDVVDFSIVPTPNKLDSPLVVEFQHLSEDYGKQICSFWNFSIPNTTTGAWSTKGARIIKSTDSTTICEYDHTTNFALLMSPGRTHQAHILPLSIISAVGCGISILFLLITVTLYAVVWRFVRSDRAVILVNLCIALILSYTVFMAGVTNTKNKILCTAVAVFLHYIFLVDFAFMLAEAVDLALNLGYVFGRKSAIHWIVPACWVVPVIMVSVSASITQLQGYGNNDFCWLSIESGLRWAFIAPALLVIIINFCILIFVLKRMLNTKLMLTKTAIENGKAGIRSLCVILPLFGVTWVFGVFSVNEQLMIFQYLFAICNSLQGLFIFLFHGYFNKQVRDGLRLNQRRKRSIRSAYTKSNSQRSFLRMISKDTSGSSNSTT